MALRIVFFGSPTFAVPTLTALVGSAHRVVGVVTQPDRPRGRGQKVTAGPVKVAAEQFGIPVFQPERLKDAEFLSAFDALEADLGVVAAYGRLLPQVLIDWPPLGMINVHASLLPRWRGAAPIHRAVMAGDAETGITIMRVVLALDAGPMLARVASAIGEDETSAEVETRLGHAGASLLVETADLLSRGPVRGEAQDDSLVTYARRLERADGQVDWRRNARDLHNQIRGLHPWPLAESTLAGQRLRLVASKVETATTEAAPGTIVVAGGDGLTVATGTGCVRITQVQPDGRGVMAVSDWLNGRRVAAGDTFGTPLE